MNKDRIISILKKAGIIALYSVVILGTIYALVSANKQLDKVKCNEVKVRLLPETELRFINRPIILESLAPGSGENGLKGSTIPSLNVAELEKRIASNKFVRHSEVFTDMNGVLHIDVDQKVPILRINNSTGENYYIDAEGRKIPESPIYTAHVPIASGNIYERIGDTLNLTSFIGSELLKIATYVDKDAFWKAQIEQIFVTADNELVLIPKIGNHVIRFGNTSDMEVKFSKLLLFYREALSRIGWDKYRELDLRFKDQIVCKKIS